MNRRSFVKIAVGASAAAVTAGTVAALTKPALNPREAGLGNIPYFGAHRVGGPAPRGVPLIPLELKDGVLHGRPTFPGPDGAPVNALDWYKYCQHQTAGGLDPNFQSSNVCRYFTSEGKLKDEEVVRNMWYKDLLGQNVKVDDFTEPFKGAAFQWRSEGQIGTSILTGVIIRYKKEDVSFPQSDLHSPAKPIKDAAVQDAIRKNVIVEHGDSFFVGVSLFCTHFCCTPGWKEAERQAKARGAWDNLFCTCHFSIYQPREIVLFEYGPEPATKPNWPDTPE